MKGEDMNVSTAIKSVNKQSISRVWADTRHFAKVLSITLSIGAAVKLGLPGLTASNGTVTLQADANALLAVFILAVAMMALNDWLRR